MVYCMKTTVEIDDALLIAAKKRAAEQHCSLRSLIQDGLRYRLGKKKPANQARECRVKWVTVKGGLPEDAHLENREKMHEWLKT